MKFTQTEVEAKIAEPLTHGMLDEIAKGTSTYPATVYKYFNQNDERQSPYFRVLAMQAVIDEKDVAVGDEVWNRFCAMRSASRPAPTLDLCVEHELGDLSKEFSDVVVAKCEGKSLTDQLVEIDELAAQLDRYKSALMRGQLTIINLKDGR